MAPTSTAMACGLDMAVFSASKVDGQADDEMRDNEARGLMTIRGIIISLFLHHSEHPATHLCSSAVCDQGIL